MIRIILSALLIGVVSNPAWSAGEAHKPKHGGIVLKTKSGDFELVAKPERSTFMLATVGKPMKLTSASGKVAVFNGVESKEAPLALVGDKLEAKGPFKVAPGTKVLAEVSVNGKPAVAARFTVK